MASRYRLALFLSLLLALSAGPVNGQGSNAAATASSVNFQTVEWDRAVDAFSERLAGQVALDDVGGMAASAVSRTGSISKSVTAMVLLRLVDRGIVHLDDPVEEHLPEFAVVAQRRPDAGAVTLRHLASHTAGLEREPSNVAEMVTGPIGIWEERIVQSLVNTAYDSVPGARYQYSNIGFGALGLALSRAARIPFMELVQEEVFDPLGMTGSSFVVVGGELEPRLAKGYLNRRDGTVDAETPEREHAG